MAPKPAPDDSSRFEELPPSPPRSPSPTPSHASTSSSSHASFKDAQDADDALAAFGAKLHLHPHADQDSGDEEEEAVWYEPSELRDILNRATAFKATGNTAFGRGYLDAAILAYRDGLAELPPPPPPERTERPDVLPERSNDETKEETERKRREQNAVWEKKMAEIKKGKQKEREAMSDEQKELMELRSVLSANIGACYLRQKNWKAAVEACSDALRDNPDYPKALTRRATANESLGTWSSLTAALEDQKHLLELPSPPSTARSAVQRLPPLIAAQGDKEKDEMLGKLKELGNSVLGKFGMSTDNFKFTPQEGGGYSFNFER